MFDMALRPIADAWRSFEAVEFATLEWVDWLRAKGHQISHEGVGRILEARRAA
jgi:hypothetical protein